MSGVTARHRPSAPRRWAAPIGGFLRALLAVETVVLVLAGAALTALGYRVSVIRSGSMRPTLGIGAVVVSKPISPLDLRPGDLVTFRGAAVGGENVTHRVVSTMRIGNAVEVVTKGDANTTTERWRAPVAGRLGLGVFHVDGVGRWLAVLASGWVRSAAIWVGAAVALRMLLSWIWRPGRHRAACTPAHRR